MLMIKETSGSGCEGVKMDEEREILQKMVETEPKLFVIQGDVYEVEKLVGVKTVKGKRLYRVRWRGYGKESDTLEPEENLFSCKDMIEDLEAKLKEKHDRKKGKKLLKMQTLSRDPSNPVPEVSRISRTSVVTWQASEIQPIGAHSKDTFWRDFDEGKISVSGAVYDKDMYSKVKERATRTSTLNEPCKPGEFPTPKENPPSPPLCPKVLLKRKPCNRPTDNLTYKSTLKKPIGLQVRKRKKYDVLRDYRRRKSRIHRKRNIDENGRRKLLKTVAKIENGQTNSNILQELLINDEKGTSFPEYVLNSSKNEADKINCLFKSKLSPCKDSACSEILGTDGRKSQSLICKISVQENTVTAYPAFGPRSDRARQLSQNGAGLNIMASKMFSSLLDAIVNDKLEKVERLCSNAYIVNCSRSDGTTALMVSAHLGKYYSTRILLKANAHKDKQNQKGETALMLACKSKHSEVVSLLLKHGANFALTNSEGVNVLKISNQCGNPTNMHYILIEHIVRVVSKFESEARLLIDPIAQIKYALFPIQCFSLNEGPEYSINFHHHVKLESPERSTNQNLLFIAHTSFHEKDIKCQFDVKSIIDSVKINGVKQDIFEDVCSVFKVSGLQNGSNRVTITTVHSPQSEVNLIVCAYKVHRSVVCFPSQKLKGDF